MLVHVQIFHANVPRSVPKMINCVCLSQRRDIVTGTVEPTDEECEWHSDREEEEELAVSTLLFYSSSAPSDHIFSYLCFIYFIYLSL